MGEESLIDTLTRRQLLRGGLFVGTAAFLAGCQQPTRVVGQTVPGPLWPDLEKAAEDPPLPPTVRPAPEPNVVFPTPEVPPSGVIPRSRWTTAQVIESRVSSMGGVSRITVHHEGMIFSGSTDMSSIARRLSNIRTAHLNRRPEPFGDIGYHYIIDPAGRIWEGRPLRYQGAHVERKNEHNLGIMVMGNFEQQRPTQAQLLSLERFVIDQMKRYQVPVSRLYTHREIGDTLCPGRNLQRWMLAQRSPAGSFARI